MNKFKKILPWLMVTVLVLIPVIQAINAWVKMDIEIAKSALILTIFSFGLFMIINVGAEKNIGFTKLPTGKIKVRTEEGNITGFLANLPDDGFITATGKFIKRSEIKDENILSPLQILPGIYWIGIPPFVQIKEHDIPIGEIVPKDNGFTLVSRITKSDFIKQFSINNFQVKDVENCEGIKTTLIGTIKWQVTDVQLIINLGSNWYSYITSVIQGTIRDYIATLKTSDMPGLGVKTDSKKAMKNAASEYVKSQLQAELPALVILSVDFVEYELDPAAQRQIQETYDKREELKRQRMDADLQLETATILANARTIEATAAAKAIELERLAEVSDDLAIISALKDPDASSRVLAAQAIRDSNITQVGMGGIPFVNTDGNQGQFGGTTGKGKKGGKK